MKKYSFLLLVIVVGVAFAHPSFNGYTGLFYTPTAEVLAPNSWSAGAYSVELDEVFPDRYCFSFGFPGNMELNLLKLAPDSGEKETIISGKYQIFPESKGQAALSVGAIDITKETETTVYLVASRTLTGAFEVKKRRIFETIGHIGIAGGGMDGIFAGIEFVLAPSLRLIGEYDTRHFNIGGRIIINDQVAITGAVFDFNKFGMGVSFSKVL
ncbi:MAG: hypothetical protein ACP5QS_08070 [bacterium]